MANLQPPTPGNCDDEGVANLENATKSKKGDDMSLHNAQEEDPKYGSEVPKGLDGAKSTSNETDSETPKGPELASQEEPDLQKNTDSPLKHENGARKSPFQSPLHRNAGLISGGGDTPKRAHRQGDRSFEVSPMHPHSHARLGGGKGSGVSSPSWERKGSSEGGRGIAPTTPLRSRLRPITKGDETPDDSPVVPKFGDWDDNDPASAEQFTQVFERVRDDKQSGDGKVPIMSTEASYRNSEKQYRQESSKGCSCFPWLSK